MSDQQYRNYEGPMTLGYFKWLTKEWPDDTRLVTAGDSEGNYFSQHLEVAGCNFDFKHDEMVHPDDYKDHYGKGKYKENALCIWP